jgi:AcrR family transcriptional regulator
VEAGASKQRILELAYQLGGRYGLEALTIGGLASELGMSKAGVHGHFGSKQALQLATVRYARGLFMRDIIEPAGNSPDGVPRLWAMCITLTTYSVATGLHGGDFWTKVATEHDARTGPVRDAIEATMKWWTQRLADLVAAGVEGDQLVPCDPAQLAFEFQAVFNAGGHYYRLYNDPKSPARARSAIRERLKHFRGPNLPPLRD